MLMFRVDLMSTGVVGKLRHETIATEDSLVRAIDSTGWQAAHYGVSNEDAAPCSSPRFIAADKQSPENPAKVQNSADAPNATIQHCDDGPSDQRYRNA